MVKVSIETTDYITKQLLTIATASVNISMIWTHSRPILVIILCIPVSILREIIGMK